MMIQTLTTSGALWELHALKDEFAIAARWKALRLRQLRRAIRQQRRKVFMLQLREIFQRRRLINALAKRWESKGSYIVPPNRSHPVP